MNHNSGCECPRCDPVTRRHLAHARQVAAKNAAYRRQLADVQRQREIDAMAVAHGILEQASREHIAAVEAAIVSAFQVPSAITGELPYVKHHCGGQFYGNPAYCPRHGDRAYVSTPWAEKKNVKRRIDKAKAEAEILSPAEREAEIERRAVAAAQLDVFDERYPVYVDKTRQDGTLEYNGWRMERRAYVLGDDTALKRMESFVTAGNPPLGSDVHPDQEVAQAGRAALTADQGSAVRNIGAWLAMALLSGLALAGAVFVFFAILGMVTQVLLGHTP